MKIIHFCQCHNDNSRLTFWELEQRVAASQLLICRHLLSQRYLGLPVYFEALDRDMPAEDASTEVYRNMREFFSGGFDSHIDAYSRQQQYVLYTPGAGPVLRSMGHIDMHKTLNPQTNF